jgi:adenylate cyclase
MSALVVFKAAPGSYYSDPGTTPTHDGTPAMLKPLESANGTAAPREQRGAGLLAPLDFLANRWPFVSLFLLVFFSNGLGSYFNWEYNKQLIAARYMDDAQRDAFWYVAVPWYNAVAYPLGVALTILLLLPLARCRQKLLASEQVPPAQLLRCRRHLMNLPFYQVCINFLGWIPGAFVFPLVICWVGGENNAAAIWVQFVLSFFVSALLTTAQTFFLLETYLIRYFYPDFFRDARPGDVRGAIRISFGIRLLILWSSVAMPLVALLMVALSFGSMQPGAAAEVRTLPLMVALVGMVYGMVVFWFVGRDIYLWVVAQAVATEQIELGNYEVHIQQKRPDEWGRLTDRFNDMVAALSRARQVRETLGQFINPEVRDDILQNYPGLGGHVQEVTVLFADIRGFTRRTAGEDPARVVEMLNRFLSLTVDVIEGRGDLVNKFLGDGIMALFGVRRLNANHADQAVAAARELLTRLAALNEELVAKGEKPLAIGIGIHTGPALIGCIGAKVTLPDGREGIRREFTAIGETVNLASRVEQLTKKLGGPILLTDQTREQLRATLALHSHGEVEIYGYDGTLKVFQVMQA